MAQVSDKQEYYSDSCDEEDVPGGRQAPLHPLDACMDDRRAHDHPPTHWSLLEGWMVRGDPSKQTWQQYGFGVGVLVSFASRSVGRTIV